MRIPESELILNADKSIYHLKLKPSEVAASIITVGDPMRVDAITKHFDKLYLTRVNREFKTVTGELGGKPVTVIATGIGTDNIDIVFNELDALFNIDFETREIKEQKTRLQFIRIGTSGTIREDVDIDSTIISKYAVGLDGLLNFYSDESAREKELEQLFADHTEIDFHYAVAASSHLATKFSQLGKAGITITATGFYGPQSRNVRLKAKHQIPELVKDLKYNALQFTNLEMETAGIYALAKMLGHEAISINAILANRVTGAFSKQPAKTIEVLIDKVLNII